MRKFKFLIIFLFTAFIFMPFVKVQAATLSCITSKNCVEVSADCARISAYNQSTKELTISTSGNGGSGVSSINVTNFNEVDVAVLNGSVAAITALSVYVCQFSDITKISGAVDTDKKAICLIYKDVTSAIGVSIDSKGSFYQCVFGDTIATRKPVMELYICPTGKTCSNSWSTTSDKVFGTSCRTDGECRDGLCKCKDGTTSCAIDQKVCTAVAGSSTQSASATTTTSAASYVGQAAATFGEGNVQCGTRKVTCTKGGWMASLSDQCACCGTCTPDDILVVANKALEWLFGIVGALGLLMFVYGGAMWVMSRGESGMIGKGKSALVNTAIGMIIMFASSAIIVALQTGIGLNSDVKVTPTGTYKYDETASKSASKEDASVKYGEIKLGAACKVLKSSKETQCAEGMYCYSKNSSNGVCLPRTPKATLDGGADCYVLPGGKTMCKSGNCEVTGKTTPDEGEQGKCEIKKEVGVACMRLAGADSQCNKGLACYNESGKVNKEGICLPTSKSSLIKSVEGGSTCYKLKGSLSMCASGTCQTAKGSAIGTAGKCPVAKEYGESCTKDSDCVENGNCYKSKCIPLNTRNRAYQESCYVLENAPNDCNSEYKCIPTAQQATFHGESRATGSEGNCFGYKTLKDGALANYAYECANGQQFYSYGGSNFCIMEGFAVPGELSEEGGGCTKITLQGINTVIHDCKATNDDGQALTCSDTGTCVVE